MFFNTDVAISQPSIKNRKRTTKTVDFHPSLHKYCVRNCKNYTDKTLKKSILKSVEALNLYYL